MIKLFFLTSTVYTYTYMYMHMHKHTHIHVHTQIHTHIHTHTHTHTHTHRTSNLAQECHPEYLFTESKFLCSDALLELIKALTFASRSPDQHETLGTTFDEDSALFFMEQLVTVAMENKLVKEQVHMYIHVLHVKVHE